MLNMPGSSRVGLGMPPPRRKNKDESQADLGTPPSTSSIEASLDDSLGAVTEDQSPARSPRATSPCPDGEAHQSGLGQLKLKKRARPAVATPPRRPRPEDEQAGGTQARARAVSPAQQPAQAAPADYGQAVDGDRDAGPGRRRVIGATPSLRKKDDSHFPNAPPPPPPGLAPSPTSGPGPMAMPLGPPPAKKSQPPPAAGVDVGDGASPGRGSPAQRRDALRKMGSSTADMLDDSDGGNDGGNKLKALASVSGKRGNRHLIQSVRESEMAQYKEMQAQLGAMDPEAPAISSLPTYLDAQDEAKPSGSLSVLKRFRQKRHTGSQPVVESPEKGEEGFHKAKRLLQGTIRKFKRDDKKTSQHQQPGHAGDAGITGPTDFSHVSHLGVSSTGIKAHNLPPVLQKLFERLDSHLQNMGHDGITASECEYLLKTAVNEIMPLLMQQEEEEKKKAAEAAAAAAAAQASPQPQMEDELALLHKKVAAMDEELLRVELLTTGATLIKMRGIIRALEDERRKVLASVADKSLVDELRKENEQLKSERLQLRTELQKTATQADYQKKKRHAKLDALSREMTCKAMNLSAQQQSDMLSVNEQLKVAHAKVLRLEKELHEIKTDMSSGETRLAERMQAQIDDERRARMAAEAELARLRTLHGLPAGPPPLPVAPHPVSPRAAILPPPPGPPPPPMSQACAAHIPPPPAGPCPPPMPPAAPASASSHPKPAQAASPQPSSHNALLSSIQDAPKNIKLRHVEAAEPRSDGGSSDPTDILSILAKKIIDRRAQLREDVHQEADGDDDDDDWDD